MDTTIKVSYFLPPASAAAANANELDSAGKLSLSTHNSESDGKNDGTTRAASSGRRFGGGDSSHGGRNPFNAFSPLATSGISSPNSSASTAFGLGSGAFASFGSASKTPKTPGAPFDFSKGLSGTETPPIPTEKRERSESKPSSSSLASASKMPVDDVSRAANAVSQQPHKLKYTWVIWYRPPTSKNADYEKSIVPVCRMSTAEDFWRVYVHLKRPSTLPTVSDYHFFREGIRPVWEDDENKKGGKWIIRLKKGVSDRYWEDLLLNMIGDQFFDAGQEICGAVVSVRSNEDVLSIWTKFDGGKNIKIRFVPHPAPQAALEIEQTALNMDGINTI
jgi:translation initiation factor 4E